MNKSILLLLLMASTALTWLQRPVGTLVDRMRSQLGIGEEDTIRALIWARVQVHNLMVSPATSQRAGRPMLGPDEQVALRALCQALEAEPAVYMALDDAVLSGEPQVVTFKLPTALSALARELAAVAHQADLASAPHVLALGSTKTRRTATGWRKPAPVRGTVARELAPAAPIGLRALGLTHPIRPALGMCQGPHGHNHPSGRRSR